MKKLFRCFDAAGGCTLDLSREAENSTTICWGNGARVVGTATFVDPVTRAETGTTARFNSKGRLCVAGTYHIDPRVALDDPVVSIEDVYTRKRKQWVIRRTLPGDASTPVVVVTCPSGRTETYFPGEITGPGPPRCVGFPKEMCREGTCP